MICSRTPTLVYYFQEGASNETSIEPSEHPMDRAADAHSDGKKVFDFATPGIRFLNQPTVEEIERLYRQWSEEEIRYGRLHLWVVLDMADITDDSASRLNGFFSLVKDSLRNRLALNSFEVDCLVLSPRRLYRKGDSLVDFIKSAVDREFIQYAIVLNPYNYAWTAPGNLLIPEHDAFLIYGYSILECLHASDYLLDEVASPFADLLSDRYIFTVGSSIRPIGIRQNREEQESKGSSFRIWSGYEKRINILLEVLQQRLSGLGNNYRNKTLPDDALERCTRDILKEIARENERLQGDGGRSQSEVEMEFLESMFRLISSHLPVAEMLACLKIRFFMSAVSQAANKQLPLLLKILTREVCSKEDFVRIAADINRAISDAGDAWENDLNVMNGKKCDDFFNSRAIRNKLGVLHNKLEWVIFRSDRPAEKSYERIFTVFRDFHLWNSKKSSENATRKETESGIFEDAKFVKATKKLIIAQIARRVLEMYQIKIQKAFLPEILQTSPKALEQTSNSVRMLRLSEPFVRLCSLIPLLEDDAPFDEDRWHRRIDGEVLRFLPDFFKKVSCDTSGICIAEDFAEFLDFIIRTFLTSVAESANEQFVRSREEYAPFFDCALNLRRCRSVKRFVFARNVRSGIPNASETYVCSEKYDSESLSLFGPWNERECFKSNVCKP